MYQINTICKTSACATPYAIDSIMDHIVDYETTHGMTADNYEIVVIVHSAGQKLVLDNKAIPKHNSDNPFQADMGKLLNKPGVKILFCQNTANGKGIVKDHMIDGIGFVTAGVSAITDLLDRRYRYV